MTKLRYGLGKPDEQRGLAPLFVHRKILHGESLRLKSLFGRFGLNAARGSGRL
jgi:hypothetical protein